MNAPKYTAGPWKLDAEDPRYIRSVKTKEYIACRQSGNPADGPLLRAAPELYEALQVFVATVEDDGEPLPGTRWHREWEAGRAALAKAVQS